MTQSRANHFIPLSFSFLVYKMGTIIPLASKSGMMPLKYKAWCLEQSKCVGNIIYCYHNFGRLWKNIKQKIWSANTKIIVNTGLYRLPRRDWLLYVWIIKMTNFFSPLTMALFLQGMLKSSLLSPLICTLRGCEFLGSAHSTLHKHLMKIKNTSHLAGHPFFLSKKNKWREI